VFGRFCAGGREDDLLYIRRTEQVEHSDGATTSDVHEDSLCYDRTKCVHTVELTEYDQKEVNCIKCVHNEEKKNSVRRVFKWWEGNRKNTNGKDSHPKCNLEVVEDV